MSGGTQENPEVVFLQQKFKELILKIWFFKQETQKKRKTDADGNQ
jgi:hypothetical protein